MTTIHTLVQEHEAMARFVEGQRTKGRDTSAVVTAQFNGMLNKVSMLKELTPETAKLLTDTFDEGPWAAEQKEKFDVALASRLSSCSGNQRGTARPQQSCPTFENYLRQCQWDAIKGPSLAIAVQTVAEAAHAIGCVCPNEATQARMAATVSACHLKAVVGDKQMHDLAKAIHDAIKVLDKQFAYCHTHLKVYPDSPLNLPQPMLDHAFSEDLPIPCDRPVEVHTAAQRKFMRGTARGLRPATAADEALIHRGSGSGTNEMAQKFMMMCAEMFGGGRGNHSCKITFPPNDRCMNDQQITPVPHERRDMHYAIEDKPFDKGPGDRG